ncbi:MAG: hypothetical protein AB4290_10430 [Spirulina sp.]
MAKKLVFVALGLAIAFFVMLFSSPTPAQSPDPAVYAWEYSRPGSDRLVCQKLSLHLKSLPPTTTTRAQPIHTHSQIVSDRFCADLTQPIDRSPVTSHQSPVMD